MRSFDWSQAWQECLGSQTIPYTLVVRNGSDVQGILPLALDCSTIRGRRLVLAGSGKACGDNLGILFAPGFEEQVARELAQWLSLAKGNDRWDCLDLDGVQPGNVAMAAFLEQLQTVQQLDVEVKSSESCWAIDLSGGWDAIFAKLSNRMRRMVNNNFLAQYINTGRARLKVAESLEEALEMLKITADLHQSRWQECNIDGCFAVDGFNDFLVAMVSKWWPLGIAYVANLELDGRPVAGVIGMWERDELAIYLVGMDVEAREHRPGWLASVESVRHAIQAGKSRFNFLRGDEEYKGRLGAEPTVQQRWIVTSPRLLPRLRGATVRKGIEVRNWFRRRADAKTLARMSKVNQQEPQTSD